MIQRPVKYSLHRRQDKLNGDKILENHSSFSHLKKKNGIVGKINQSPRDLFLQSFKKAKRSYHFQYILSLQKKLNLQECLGTFSVAKILFKPTVIYRNVLQCSVWNCLQWKLIFTLTGLYFLDDHFCFNVVYGVKNVLLMKKR